MVLKMNALGQVKRVSELVKQWSKSKFTGEILSFYSRTDAEQAFQKLCRILFLTNT